MFTFVVTIYSTDFFFECLLCASLLNVWDILVNKTDKAPLKSLQSSWERQKKQTCIITGAAMCYEGNKPIALLRNLFKLEGAAIYERQHMSSLGRRNSVFKR